MIETYKVQMHSELVKYVMDLIKEIEGKKMNEANLRIDQAVTFAGVIIGIVAGPSDSPEYTRRFNDILSAMAQTAYDYQMAFNTVCTEMAVEKVNTSSMLH